MYPVITMRWRSPWAPRLVGLVTQAGFGAFFWMARALLSCRVCHETVPISVFPLVFPGRIWHAARPIKHVPSGEPMPRRGLVFAFSVALTTSAILSNKTRAFASGLNYVHGIQDTCRASPVAVVDEFLAVIARLTAVCDATNAAMAKKRSPSCPPGLCLAEFKRGDTTPPQLDVEITYSSDVTSTVNKDSTPVTSYIDSGGTTPTSTISGGVTSANGRTSTQGLVVRVGLTVSLGRNPDEMTCVNPLSETLRDAIVLRVIDLSSEGSAQCE